MKWDYGHGWSAINHNGTRWFVDELTNGKAKVSKSGPEDEEYEAHLIGIHPSKDSAKAFVRRQILKEQATES